MATTHMTTTKNYGLFTLTNLNRQIDLAKRAKLKKSMQEYGYIHAYPIHCVRENGKLFVYDGQHRLAVAQELGLAVSYVVGDRPIDIPSINNTQMPWNTNDYAQSYAAQGKEDYQELIDFASQHGLTISVARNILAGQGSDCSNTIDTFKAGTYKIKDRHFADRIARLYMNISSNARHIRTRFFVSALYAVCRIQGIDDKRLVDGAGRCPESLVKYGSRDAFLGMLEHIYNFGRSKKYPLKIEAENAMAARSLLKEKRNSSPN